MTIIYRLPRILSCLAVLSAALIMPLVPAWADVNIYRGVDAGNNGRATLSPSQFAFNPDMSTFNDPALAPVQKRCNYRFTVTFAGEPQPGDSGPVAGLAGYIATFDNIPEGHWGVTQPEGTTTDQAKAEVSAFAQANRGNVVNGTANNCN